MSDAALAISGVSVDYGATRALADVHLTVAPGEIVAVIGPSGCGKSSLLRAVAGLVAARGRMSARGRALDPLPPHRRGVGVVFQDHALFPHLDVAGNVGFGLVEAGVPTVERVRRVQGWLARIGLADRGGDDVERLSGGERQRVALARTLAPEPPLVLLDEPFASLDAALRVRLSLDVASWLRELQAGALFVTHDLDEAIAVADRVLVLRGGRMVQLDDPERLLAAPIDPWTARFVGHANVWQGAAARRLPGAPAAALLRSGAVRWGAVGAIPASVQARTLLREGVRLTLHVPSWGVEVVWTALPRDYPGGSAPSVGDVGALDVPDEAWWTFDGQGG
jgi:ABC-type Fe3+/spermidine/putrescine transport system ATPase subunit